MARSLRSAGQVPARASHGKVRTRDSSCRRSVELSPFRPSRRWRRSECVHEPVRSFARRLRCPAGAPMATESACLVIADISGYTGYLAGVEIDHAQDILADLMGTIVSALRPGFRLAKLEGDAAFTFAITEQMDGSLLLDTIERCYFGFRRRRRDVRQATSCECNACVRIPDLNLKFVVHHGTILRQRVAGREELLGSDVIVVHRLLKNDVVELDGYRGVRAVQPAVRRRDGCRCGGPRHAAQRARPTSTSGSFRSGSTTWNGDGRRRSRARASSSTRRQAV